METAKRSKKIINYLDKLSALSDVEEIYTFIFNELTSFKKISNVSLCFSASVNKNIIYFKEKKRVWVKPVEKLWPAEKTMRLDNVADSHFLANCLKRPVGQLLSFPLTVNQMKEQVGSELPAVIYIEHSGSKEELEPLINDLISYIQPVQFALERAFLQEFMHNASIEWQNTFDGLKDPICIIDSDFNIFRANKSFSEDDPIEKCYKAFAGLEQPCKRCPANEVINSGSYQTSIIKNKNKTFEVHSYPISRNKSEIITTIVSHYVDITKKQDLLGRMLQSEKLAVIGHLAGNIAHELNNPLTGIKSLTEVLSVETKNDKQLNQDLNEIKLATIRCQNIIKSLMLFSTESENDNKQKVPINEQVNISLTLLKSALRNLTVNICLTESEAEIFVVPELFVQVLYNLIQNACQACSEGGVITISTLVEGQSVIFKVQDTGSGISKEIMSEIFNPFFTTKNKKEGTGLGLSMSQGVIESFGGKIIVNSVEGVGSEFIIRLPKVFGDTK